MYDPVFAALVLVIGTALLLNYYRSPDTPLLITLVIYISWFLGFAGILLLPFDLADVQTYGRSQPWVSRAWYVIYWTTFVLTWVVLPIMFAYLDSGAFTHKARLAQALRSQIRSAVLAVVSLVGFIIYLLAQHFALADIDGFVMALGNTYGLLMVIVLLGNGIVEVPRALWRASFADKELQRLYFRSSTLDSDLHDAMYALDDIEEEVLTVRNAMRSQTAPSGEYRMLLDSCFDTIMETQRNFRYRGPEEVSHSGSKMLSSHRQATNVDVGTVTVETLADLHARLKRAQMTLQAEKIKWEALVAKVDETEHISKGTLVYPTAITDRTGIGARLHAALLYLMAVLDWHWKVQLSPFIYRLLALTCLVLSVGVMWSEVALSTPWALSPFGHLVKLVGHGSPFAIELMTFFPLLYLSLATYRSLFKFKLFGDFSLQGPQLSLGRQLLINSQYLIRLQFPLAYNFLLLLRNPASERTAFRSLMKNMEVVPVMGEDFNVYAPLVMVVLSLFTVFHGYARLLRAVGFQHEDIMTVEEHAEMIEEGKSLARRRRSRVGVAPTPDRRGSNSLSSSSSGGGGNMVLPVHSHYRQIRS